jgi:hypothetical protein
VSIEPENRSNAYRRRQSDGDRLPRQPMATTPTTASNNSASIRPLVETAGTGATSNGEVGVTVGVVVDVGVVVGVGVGSGKQTHGAVPLTPTIRLDRALSAP